MPWCAPKIPLQEWRTYSPVAGILQKRALLGQISFQVQPAFSDWSLGQGAYGGPDPSPQLQGHPGSWAHWRLRSLLQLHYSSVSPPVQSCFLLLPSIGVDPKSSQKVSWRWKQSTNASLYSIWKHPIWLPCFGSSFLVAIGSEVKLSGFNFLFAHLFTVGPWAGNLISLDVSLLICKTGIVFAQIPWVCPRWGSTRRPVWSLVCAVLLGKKLTCRTLKL